MPSVIICDDEAKDPSDCLSPLTSAKSYFSESRYSARYFPANIPWPVKGPEAWGGNENPPDSHQERKQDRIQRSLGVL
jgi:hypothetical protein